MSNYYVYVLLGPTVYYKYYTSPPDPPSETELLPIKREILSLKKASSLPGKCLALGLSKDLTNIIKHEDPIRDQEIYDLMSKIHINPLPKTDLEALLNSDQSKVNIVSKIPLGLIIKTLESYTDNAIVKATLGCTAESIYYMLLGYKALVISHYLGHKHCLVHAKLGINDTKGHSLRKDYIHMSYFLAYKAYK